MNPSLPSPERRSFLHSLKSGLAPLAALAIGKAAFAQDKPAPPANWQPARHQKDDWLDQLPGKHRLVFDTTSPEGFGDALAFTRNFLVANRTDYGLQNSDLAIVIVARHQATPFTYTDAMWAKYGVTIAEQSHFVEPRSKLSPKANVYTAGDYNNLLPNAGVTLDSLAKQGVQFAVCAMSTRRFAGAIAEATHVAPDAAYNELAASLIASARMVPAGIVAVNRAQERGYTLVRS